MLFYIICIFNTTVCHKYYSKTDFFCAETMVHVACCNYEFNTNKTIKPRVLVKRMYIFMRLDKVKPFEVLARLYFALCAKRQPQDSQPLTENTKHRKECFKPRGR